MSTYLPDLITLYKGLLGYDLDDFTSGGQTPTDAQAITRINQAKDTISKALFQTDPSITLTLVASTLSYDLRNPSTVSRKVLRVFEVIVNNVTLRNSGRIRNGLWSIAEFQRRYTSWRTDAAGTPFAAVDAGNQKIILYPAPTSTVVSTGNNYIYGQYLAADLAAPTTVTSGATSATQAVGSTSGMVAGMNLYFGTAAVERTISSVASSTSVVLTSSLTTTTSEACSIVPDIPDEVRPAIAYLAAIIASEPSVSETEQFARLDKYGARWTALVQAIARENKNALIDLGSLGSNYGEFVI